ncbi:MAG: TetR/AcrR family transcriptional regulator [Ilumatobacteraceae bacterium]
MSQDNDGRSGAPARPTRRAMQAEQTRRDILLAARRRFADQGFAATNLKEIAADAHVSVQTLYDSVGTKSDLVRELNDLVDAEAGILEIVIPAMSSIDPAVVAATPAKVTRRLVERCGDILRASLGTLHAEPGLRVSFDEGQRRHRAGNGSIAGRLAAMGALRDGLDVAEATNTMAVLSDFRVAFILMDEGGLSLDAVEAWITNTIAGAVLK